MIVRFKIASVCLTQGPLVTRRNENAAPERGRRLRDLANHTVYIVQDVEGTKDTHKHEQSCVFRPDVLNCCPLCLHVSGLVAP
jgi:hypothetical protein